MFCQFENMMHDQRVWWRKIDEPRQQDHHWRRGHIRAAAARRGRARA